MLLHIAERDNDFTLRDFVKHWAPGLARSLQTINTHQLGMATKMPLGTYLFTDLERQSRLLRDLQAQIFEHLEEGGAKVLNHPSRVLDRMGLIARFHELGINSYRGFNALEVPSDLRFPVFLRMARNHAGSETPLLQDWDEYEEAVIRLITASRPPDDLVAIEYADASNEEGLFVKCAAFRIGDRIVPRGIYFGDDWMMKAHDTTPTWRAEEKWDYVKTNPHRDEIMKAFEAANIEYGRCDYAICNGRIEFWEINTNPSFAGPVDSYSPESLEQQRWVAAQVSEALTALDTVSESGHVPIKLHWQPGCLNAEAAVT